MSDIQHVLERPSTYMGGVKPTEADLWLLEDGKFVHRAATYVQGLYKLFDEAIVNSRDHVERMAASTDPTKQPVTHIDVSIDATSGVFSINNDGNGLDVAMHPEHKLWIPELIFANLRTSTNYGDQNDTLGAGQNGYGAKLILIWSTECKIDTLDVKRGLRYTQIYRNNLSQIEAPVVVKCSTKRGFTCITFKPDYARFGISLPLSPDMMALFRRRVYDIAAVTARNVKVTLDGAVVQVHDLKQYADLAFGHMNMVYEKDDTPTALGRWEYAVAMVGDVPGMAHEFTQISFVNGIHTNKGGKHVDYIINQIAKKLVEYIEKKKKVKVTNSSIKEQLFLVLRCDIAQPTFDSQAKECLNTAVAKFGSVCTVSDKFIEKLAKLGVMEKACAITDLKEAKTAAKKTDGAKTRTVRGIEKLNDANWAGTEKSKECVLILCEGDSAKAGVISGLKPADRDTVGVYPLKGKPLNVRDETRTKVADNKEITDIKKILGLETGRVYKDMADVNRSLRYSRVCFIADQDVDGSHIKGLCANLFDVEWPSLMAIPGFLAFINTPIIKAKKGAEEAVFYNDGEYRQWVTATPNANKWTIKYYKGLGTSTAAEWRAYMANRRLIGFELTPQCKDTLDMVFNDKRANNRKTWLDAYDRDLFVDTSKPLISYTEFVNKELIHYSKYSCERAIPSLMDGLKTSQRKILFCAFKRNLTTELKVAQFAGYVSEHACYHHGEKSLNDTIVGMAQNFVGSNNIHLLEPCGQFGTRLQGGKDHASERYIFTHLNPITRLLVPKSDDGILQYLKDDGTTVEPAFYAPILPLILVNGASGIGTGFSTEVLPYSPLDLCKVVRQRLANTAENAPLVPFYAGFKGSIVETTPGRFLVRGTYERVPNVEDTIRITELPIGTWTDSYTAFLEELMDPPANKKGEKPAPVVKAFRTQSTEATVDLVITLVKGFAGDIEKTFKLTTTLSTTNMHLFDADDKLKKYETVEEIIDDYMVTRLDLYEKRRLSMIRQLEADLCVAANKARFIGEILEETVDLRRKTQTEVDAVLKAKAYDMIDDKYDYLVDMKLGSLTNERVAKLNSERETYQLALDNVRGTTPNAMWLNDLDTFEAAYNVSATAAKSAPSVEPEGAKKKVVRRKVAVKA